MTTIHDLIDLMLSLGYTIHVQPIPVQPVSIPTNIPAPPPITQPVQLPDLDDLAKRFKAGERPNINLYPPQPKE